MHPPLTTLQRILCGSPSSQALSVTLARSSGSQVRRIGGNEQVERAAEAALGRLLDALEHQAPAPPRLRAARAPVP